MARDRGARNARNAARRPAPDSEIPAQQPLYHRTITRHREQERRSWEVCAGTILQQQLHHGNVVAPHRREQWRLRCAPCPFTSAPAAIRRTTVRPSGSGGRGHACCAQTTARAAPCHHPPISRPAHRGRATHRRWLADLLSPQFNMKPVAWASRAGEAPPPRNVRADRELQGRAMVRRGYCAIDRAAVEQPCHHSHPRAPPRRSSRPASHRTDSRRPPPGGARPPRGRRRQHR